MPNNEIRKLFDGMIESIDIILNSDFYPEKYSLPRIKKIVNSWYDGFKEKNTLTTIIVDDLQFIDWKITEIFDIYFETETKDKNYSERLLYDLSVLKKYWKDEMLGGK